MPPPPASRDSGVGLLVAPSLEPTLERDHVRRIPAIMDRRDALMCAYAIALGAAASAVAELLIRAIALVTNLAFYQTLSLEIHGPADNTLGVGAALIPVAGGIVVGLMARYGSRAIRGHGIPEAMEQILTNESKIPLRITFLKPVSAAIAIGTGGPFGAEGPIIATGGALGSALGQLIHVNAQRAQDAARRRRRRGHDRDLRHADRRRADRDRAAAVRVPRALDRAGRARVRVRGRGARGHPRRRRVLRHAGPRHAERDDDRDRDDRRRPRSAWRRRTSPSGVYWIEDMFEKLPIHWMWWPAIGAIAVGVIGVFAPRTLGVGYDNIENALSGNFTAEALAILCVAKLVSWAIALGSGTSGGTLAPLLTFGGAMGWLLVALCAWIAPDAGIDPRVGALVGMTAMFAGASRALLASIVVRDRVDAPDPRGRCRSWPA